MLAAIIVAAGSSTRARFDKLFASLSGQPVIQYSLDAFQRSDCVDEILVVCRQISAGAICQLADAAGTAKFTRAVTGGQLRQDSVQAGVRAVSHKAELVAVHDAARPLITPREIERVYAAARQTGAAALAVPVSDTLKSVDGGQRVIGSVERENVFAMQTPQIFERQAILDAYQRVTEAGITVSDEVSALQEIGRSVTIVPGEDHNFKITYARDLRLAEIVLQQRASRRV